MQAPNRTFALALAGAAVGFILLNHTHAAQQTIHHRYTLPLAESLLSGGGYTLQGEPAFYPIWGYPALVAVGVALGSVDLWLLVVQATAAIAGVFAALRLARVPPRLYHIALALPFLALLSVRWADGLVATGLVIHLASLAEHLRTGRRAPLLAAGLALGLVGNLRTEYLYLPLAEAAAAALPHMRGLRRRTLAAVALSGAMSLALLLPWALRAAAHGEGLRFDATNGGCVLYISLGQLPDNPWGIEPADIVAERRARALGAPGFASPEGDRLLRREFAQAVREHPEAFARKVAYNVWSAVTGGTYVGELRTLASSPERVQALTRLAANEGRAAALSKMSTAEAVAATVQSVLALASVAIIVALLLLGAWALVRGTAPPAPDGPAVALCAAVVAYKLAIIGVAQASPRHMSAVYLPLLAVGLATLPCLIARLRGRS